jgi:hypothetical protein
MAFQLPTLSPEEQIQARQLWIELMFAPTQADLDSALERFMAVSAPVRNAVAWASVAHQTHKNPPQRDLNPFD